MKKITTWFAICVALYLSGAFIAMSLNPENWYIEGRAAIGILVLLTTFIFIFQ